LTATARHADEGYIARAFWLVPDSRCGRIDRGHLRMRDVGAGLRSFSRSTGPVHASGPGVPTAADFASPAHDSFMVRIRLQGASHQQRRAVRSQCHDGGIEDAAARIARGCDEPTKWQVSHGSNQRPRSSQARAQSRFVQGSGTKARYHQKRRQPG